MSKTEQRSHKPYKGRHGARARTSWRKLGDRAERRTGKQSKVYHRRGKPQGVTKGRTPKQERTEAPADPLDVGKSYCTTCGTSHDIGGCLGPG